MGFPCDTASAQSTVGSSGPRSVALDVGLAEISLEAVTPGVTPTGDTNDVITELSGIRLTHNNIFPSQPPRQARSDVTYPCCRPERSEALSLGFTAKPLASLMFDKVCHGDSDGAFGQAIAFFRHNRADATRRRSRKSAGQSFGDLADPDFTNRFGYPQPSPRK